MMNFHSLLQDVLRVISVFKPTRSKIAEDKLRKQPPNPRTLGSLLIFMDGFLHTINDVPQLTHCPFTVC